MLGDDTTAQRLRLLQAEFVQPGSRGPGDGRTATQAHAPAPINLGIVDRIRAAVNEIETHTRAADWTTQAGPVPTDIGRVYEWAREHTAHLGTEQQDAREALIYRQGLEHAIAMGETTVVRKHPCPGCGCLGLFWADATQEAQCVNRYCLDADGLSRSWPLRHLAQQYVARQKILKRSAT